MTFRIGKNQRAAGAAMAVGVVALSIAGTAGEVRVGAGDLEIIVGPKTGAAMALDIGARACPPDCAMLNVGWRAVDARADAPIMDQNDSGAGMRRIEG